VNSYIQVKGGKWHASVSAEPTWAGDEKSVCGLTVRPVNVTRNEAPPCLDHNICSRCKGKS